MASAFKMTDSQAGVADRVDTTRIEQRGWQGPLDPHLLLSSGALQAPRRRRRAVWPRVLLLILVGYAIVMLAACGGGGDDDEPDTPAPANPCAIPPDGSRPHCVL